MSYIIMEIIHWTYDYMYKWYSKLYDKTDRNQEIYSYVYESKKPSKKDESKVEPFITRNIVVLEKLNYFTNGLYTLIDLNSPIKWLFFVHPEDKNNILYADHFSFCYEIGDSKKPVHFHSTIYIPIIEGDQISHFTGHRKDYFEDNIDISKTGDVVHIIKNPVHKQYKELLLGLIRRPWTDGKIVGGGKRKINREKAREKISDDFCYKWTENKIQNMWAFGIQNRNNIDWSIRIKTGREKIGQMYVAYHFTTSTEDEKLFQNKLAEFL